MYLENVENILLILLRYIQVCLLPFVKQPFPFTSSYKIEMYYYFWHSYPDWNHLYNQWWLGYLGFVMVVYICKCTYKVLAFLYCKRVKVKLVVEVCKTTDRLRESIIAVTSFQLIDILICGSVKTLGKMSHCILLKLQT